MTNTLTDRPPEPVRICVACLGEQLDPATRETCLRCCGTGLDPDPQAPAGIAVVSRLAEHTEHLGAALAVWATRDDSKPQPEVREAANTAMDAIDAMLAELHSIRSRLVTEVRQSDDATAARVDRMLAQRRDGAR